MKFLSVMVILCTLYAEPAQTPRQEKQTPGQQVLTAEDFKERKVDFDSSLEAKTFLIQINRTLPPYQIRLIPDLSSYNSSKEYLRPVHVGQIVIQKPASKAQTIEVEAIAGGKMFLGYFKAEDINFDGYLDLAILNEFGAKWVKYKYWLFDKKTGRFVANRLTGKLGRLSYSNIDLNSKTKEIKIGFFYGVCPQSRTYHILNGGLVLTEVEERECEADGSKIRIKRRINGKWKLVKTSDQQ